MDVYERIHAVVAEVWKRLPEATVTGVEIGPAEREELKRTAGDKYGHAGNSPFRVLVVNVDGNTLYVEMGSEGVSLILHVDVDANGGIGLLKEKLEKLKEK